ncbi:MAG: FAD-binding protein [Chitinophagales bacterium]|nr:FAD-binding protein [Chitinophagales bacterium]HAE13807.1 FAD-binding protein [Bacteroidota bacterium]MCB9022378.1 FAD-binding protein [Chitinophagales bacterium]HPE97489.1 FAD-binding protein [Chitinophagales bacterium]HPR28151.1 FAD-binding protein [Chitinophagales bacterium]
MIREVQLRLTPEQAQDPDLLRKEAISKAGAGASAKVELVRRSIDARQKQVMLQLVVRVYEEEEMPDNAFALPDLSSVTDAPEVHIIGCGPAGLFAALTCLQRGLKPVILERGKDVRSRRHDLAAINRRHIVDPDSNYCFGEGGAGTYSDGKLYTRSGKRGDIRKVLEWLVAFGASHEILVEAHPHIGTNKLPGIITAIRQFILDHGGEVHFGKRVTAIQTKNGKVSQLECNGQENIPVAQVILATGHSARDIFFMLHSSGIPVEFKPFAMGVRIEHPQVLIDQMQYHCDVRSAYLPPASYSMVEQVNKRGVYSFCMCPGGIIAPCATASEEVVTNGWSPSKRNNPFANSGFVVSVEEKDAEAYAHHGPLKGLAFQMATEYNAWQYGGYTQAAPAQRMVDFVQKKATTELPACSYQPGVVSARMSEVLPDFIANGLRGAFLQISKHKPAYYTNEAILVGVESRTSSPVRIPRDPDTLQHPGVSGLFPCGEGGGYAGGIVSAAMDGIKVAMAIPAGV